MAELTYAELTQGRESTSYAQISVIENKVSF